MFARQFLVVGIKLEDGLADELIARNAEELLPCLVHAEIASVGRLEENRLRHRFYELLNETQLLPQPPRAAHGGCLFGQPQRARGRRKASRSARTGAAG